VKKKIIIGVSAAVIVIMAIAAGIVTGALSKKKSSNDINVSCKAAVTKNEDITCYDWLKKLCNKMGIEADDYRKAAKEYGYITDSDEFSNDDIASGGFMALTSMRAMGEGKMQIYLGTDDAISDNTNIGLAINNNLIAEDSLDRGFSDQEADGILDKFDDLYYGEFWPEDIENVSYKENISQLQFFDIKDYKEDENIIYIDESAAKNLKKGDTFVFDYMGEKIAKKIVEDMGNGTFSLEDPEIDEVFNTLIVSDSASIGIDDIISYYGLDNVKVSAGKPVTMLTADVSGNINSKGFAIEAAVNDDNELEVTLTDNDTEAEYELPIKQKLNKKCENFSIKWDVNNINVGAQVKYTLKSGLKYASVGVDIDSEISGEIGVEGDFSDGILLCQTPALIGSNLVAVNVALYIVPAVDGSVNLKVEVPYYAGVSYEKGKGVNGTMGLRSSMQTSIEAEGTMGLYFRTAPMLVTMRSIPLLDAELDIGAEAEATRTGRPNGQICSDVNVKCPVFIIGVGDESVKYKNKKSLLCTMDISKSCEFTSFARSKSLHYERLADGTKQFVKECTYNEQPEDDKPKESETSTEATTQEQPTQEQVTQGTDVKESGPLHTYKTRMAEYFPEQTTFYFDYPDNWTVVSERANANTEVVIIQNDNGVQIEYMARDDKFGTEIMGNIMVEAKNDVVSKPRYNSGRELVIVKTKDYKEYSRTSPDVIEYDDGAERYALMPASTSYSICHTGIYLGCYFETPKETMFYSIPSKKLTDKDREEIIEILESFRDTP
jgi:hypothetical protein